LTGAEAVEGEQAAKTNANKTKTETMVPRAFIFLLEQLLYHLNKWGKTKKD